MRAIKLFPLVHLLAIGVVSAGEPDDRPGKVIHEAFGTDVPNNPHAKRANTPRPVSVDMDDAFQEGINIYDFGRLSAEKIAEADARSAAKYAEFKPGPLRIGLTRSFEGDPLTLDHASVVRQDLDDGNSVWTLAIRSPGALGIRVHFTEVDLGAASVVVYSKGPNGLLVRGPYSKKGLGGHRDFWTSALPDDQIFIEVTGEGHPQFKIVGILHIDNDPALSNQGRAAAELPCHLDAMCESLPPYVRNAVGRMFYVGSDGDGHVCTGTLLNDKDDETFVPYFITARHCLSTQAEVDTLDVYWLFQKDSCGGTVGVVTDYPFTHGGTLLRSYSENDMTFIRLKGDLPAGVTMTGWTTDTSVGNAVGVHHPRGAWKRAVFLDATNVCATCWCADPTDYDYYDYERGLTEPGSSGSGVFNGSGQLAGQLRGCCSDWADCDNKSCSNLSSYWAYYGEFETTYDEISHWLFLGGTINVNWNKNPLPGWPETGTPGFPFDTITEGYNYAWPGARIKIQAGDYPETITFTKEMVVVGAGGRVVIGASTP